MTRRISCQNIIIISAVSVILICFDVINSKHNIEYYFFQKKYKVYLIMRSLKTMLVLTLFIYIKFILSKFLIK